MPLERRELKRRKSAKKNRREIESEWPKRLMKPKEKWRNSSRKLHWKSRRERSRSS